VGGKLGAAPRGIAKGNTGGIIPGGTKRGSVVF